MTEESHEQPGNPAEGSAETSGNEELDRRLAEPVLKGQQGLDKAMVWAGGFLIVIAGLIAFSTIYEVPFHTADRELLVENDALHTATRWVDAVDAQGPAPLTLFALAVNWSVTPDNPAAFHTVNLLLHLLNGVLVYLLCRRLLGKHVPEAIAMLAGMLFVLHPANVQAVVLMAGRGHLLGTTFALVSVLCFIHGTGDRARPSWGSVALALVAYACACGAYFGAWWLPFAIVVVDAIVRGPGLSLVRIVPVLAYFAVLAIMLVALLALPGGVFTEIASPETLLERLAAGAGSAVSAVWPFGLSPAPNASQWGVPGAVLAGVLALIAIAGIAPALAWRVFIGGALFWFAGALLLGACAVDTGVANANRFLYLPLVGLVWVVPWAFSKIPKTPGMRTGAGLACAAVLVVLAAATYSRTALWQSEIALWRDAVRKAPGEALPKERLGLAHLQTAAAQLAQAAALRQNGYESAAGELDNEARENMSRGREILGEMPLESLSPEALFLLGQAYREMEEPDAAVESFTVSLRKDSKNQACAVELAQLLSSEASETQDRFTLLRALDYYEYAVSLGEPPPRVWAAYGTVLVMAGNYEEAAQALSRAVKEAEDGPTRFGQELKSVQTALQQVRGLEAKALELQAEGPESSQARLLVAQSLVIRNRPLYASYFLERLLDESGTPPPAWVLLGFVRAQMGQAKTFLADWPVPPGPDEQQVQLWAQLAQMCAGRGNWEDAETYLSAPQAGMSGVPMPLLSLGVMALQLRQGQRAQEYLQQATEAYPDAFAPWLVLTDLAMAQRNAAAARQYLVEAEKRNAPAEEIAKRQKQLGGGVPEMPANPGEVIIR